MGGSQRHRALRGLTLATVGLVWLLAGLTAHAQPDRLRYQEVTLVTPAGEVVASIPTGFVLELLESSMQRPRMLTFAANGDLLAGSAGGHVYRLAPPYGTAISVVRLSGYPHSVALRDGEMLIAQTDGLYRAPYRPGQTTIAPRDVELVARLPGGIGHNSRTVRLGPDGGVFASIGISGNCSDQYLGSEYPFGRRRGGVFRLLEQPGGDASFEAFGSGLRNPVDFSWHPATGAMYAANNGPDHLGYEVPPEYFSRIDPGSFHGMPWFQFDGERLIRDRCIGTRPPRGEGEVTLPVALLPSRSAPLGMEFVPEGALRAELVGDAVVALHGSWARQPSGGPVGDPATRRPPKLVVVRFGGGADAIRVEDLVSGFQVDSGARWARPAGVSFGPEGALYFTSDAGVMGLFRLRATGG